MSRKKKNENSPTGENPLGGYIEIALTHLADRLALLKTVLLRRATRKDLATVHIDVKADATTIAATDMEIGLRLKLDVLRRTGVGRVMIESHALDAMLGAYPEPRVRIHLDDATQIRVEGLQTKLKLPGADPAKEWKLTAPGSVTTSGWIVRADALESAIRRTKFAVDQSGSTRYALGGLALIFPKEGGLFMEVVATDGRRLSVVRVPVRVHGAKPERTWKPVKKGAQQNEGVPVLANKAVTTLLRIAREAGDTSIGLAAIPGEPIDLGKKTFKPGRIQAVTRDAVLTAQCPEGRYPSWREVIPADEVVAEFRTDDATRLAVLLTTAVAATDTESKGVEFTMAGGCVMIESESETKGKSQVSLTGLEMNGHGTVTIDGLMLRQFFDVIGNERLRVKYFGREHPVVFQAGPDHDFVLMPLTRDVATKPAPKPDPVSEVKPEDKGDGNVETEAKAPEPPVPVGTTPDAHKSNGKAKAK